jgi:hippurate hydrolase
MGHHDLMIPGVLDSLPEMTALRHRIHAHPELAFEEFQTSDLVAERLAAWGYEVHRGLGGTGVVGTLRRGAGPRSVGVRADMDALPLHEKTGLPYASRIEGKMHACGHDGHTATLLAAAKHLAAHGRFDGTVHLIFQPAEEGHGGAKAMIDDGLFEKFPCDAVFAFHNMPGLPTGKFGFRSGVFMASADTATIKIQGRGGHGAAPHLSVDAVTVAAYVVIALQSIVSRNVDPRQMAVVSVGAIHGGSAHNIIADSVELRLSVRAYSAEVRQQLHDRITEIVTQQARSLGATADIDYRWVYPPLVNHEAMTDFARQVAVEWLGQEALVPDMDQITGSEDFAFMLEQRPGCYLVIGNGDGEGGCMVHNPGYDFNDAILPVGASYWVKLVERFLK